uniref:THAP-type domain-containing protein n=1 Tax=Laticauda laticaudata TaxID=8630 RepID=A0A8C5S8M2_LATLA
MPNFCAAPNCTRKSTQSDLAFFRFPRDPARLMQRWVENCRRVDLEIKTPDQPEQALTRLLLLRDNAVPTIFDLTSHLNNLTAGRKRLKTDFRTRKLS